MTRTPQTAAELDAAIDALLRQRVGPRPADEPGLTATARLLRDTLPRFHPRFSFEEFLALRLAGMARDAQADAMPRRPTPIGPSADGDEAAPVSDRRRRGLVAGGAIASGVSLAIPIAGAAIVVWRRSRSSGGVL